MRVLPSSRDLKLMDESISIGETSTAPGKRRGKYCAAYGCNSRAYNVNGIHISYHFFEFPKDVHQTNRWCTVIKRRHGHDGFLVSTSTVLCHEHFWTEDISKKLSGRWDLRKGLWYCSPFVMPLSYLHHNTAVCLPDYKIPRYFSLY